MKITVNGKKEIIPDTFSIADYLSEKNIIPQQVVIEFNKEIIQRETIANITLKENDSLEILHFVGGGSK